MRLNRALVAAAYLILVLLVLIPLVESIVRVLPPRPGEPMWRFGAAGTFSGALMTLMLGMLLIAALGYVLGHRRVVRTVAVLVGLGSLVLFVAAGLFLLDALEVRNAMPEAGRASYDTNSMVALAKISLFAPIALLLSVGAWKASRRTAVRGGGRAEPLLVRESAKP